MRRLAIISAMLLCSVLASAQKRSEILKVYNWDEVIRQSDITNFEKWYEEQTGEPIKVIYQLYDSDLVAVNSVKLSHDDWDVITISANFLGSMIKENYLQPIDTALFAHTGTTNYIAKVSPYLKGLLAQSGLPGSNDPNQYMAPLAFSAGGFFYNKNKYTADEVSSWTILHDSKFKNSILVNPDPIDCHLIASFAMNSDALINGEMEPKDVLALHSDEDIARSEQWLKEGREQICGWDATFGYDFLVREKIDLLYCWSTYEQIIWQESEELSKNHVAFVHPREGSFVYIDGMVIPAYAGNTKAAAYWINYMLSPECLSGRLVDCTVHATISDSLIFNAIQNPEKYPEETDLSYMFPDLPQAAHSHSSRVSYPPYEIASRLAIVTNTGEYIDKATLALNRVMCPKPKLKEFWPEATLAATYMIYLIVRLVRKKRRQD